MAARKLNCYDCETYRVWQEGEEEYADRLIILPDSLSGIPDCYAYCEGADKVVDLSQSPEDNGCCEFERRRLMW